MYRKIFKQLFDIVLALIALILLFPVFILLYFFYQLQIKVNHFLFKVDLVETERYLK